MGGKGERGGRLEEGQGGTSCLALSRGVGGAEARVANPPGLPATEGLPERQDFQV